MIAELPDGSELRFPDTMTDAQVGAVVKRILAAEKKAKDATDAADSAVASVRGEMEALRGKFDTLLTQPKAPSAAADNAPLLAAINTMSTSVTAALERVVKAQLADTVLVRDETGDAVRSKKVTR